MPKILFLWTETNNMQYTKYIPDKKKLYKFSRLISLNYEIGNVVNNNYVFERKISRIVKPRCCHISDENSIVHGITQKMAEENGFPIEEIIGELKDNIMNVNIIVTYNTSYHYNTILAEAIRYNVIISFNKTINIDIMTFNNIIPNDINSLANKFNIDTNTSKLDLIKSIFFKLYEEYKQSINGEQVNTNIVEKKTTKKPTKAKKKETITIPVKKLKIKSDIN